MGTVRLSKKRSFSNKGGGRVGGTLGLHGHLKTEVHSLYPLLITFHALLLFAAFLSGITFSLSLAHFVSPSLLPP